MENFKHYHPDFKHLTCPGYGKPGKAQLPSLQEMTKPHIDSFDYMLSRGINIAAQDIYVPELEIPNGDKISFSIKDIVVSNPAVAQGNAFALERRMYPAECRVRGCTYSGSVKIFLVLRVNNHPMPAIERAIGFIPIMVKSGRCNLKGLPPAELMKHGEEAEEMGGYFIINGIERVIRMLILPRRNYPLATCRPSWRNRGRLYTEFGISLRCVREDETASNIVLHYLSNGTARMSIMYRKQVFYVPVVIILKALLHNTDLYIKERLMLGKEDNSFYRGCVVGMLRAVHEDGLHTHAQILKYLGKHFRIKLYLPEWYTDSQVAQFLIKNCICIHLDRLEDKFNMIVYMTQKLFSFARGECCAESSDNPMFHEVLLPGHLFQMILKSLKARQPEQIERVKNPVGVQAPSICSIQEKLENWLISLRTVLERTSKDSKKGGLQFNITQAVVLDACRKCADVTKPMDYFLSTGNLVSRTGLGLMQATGLTVVADKLNFCRYLSHFRCIHRGAFFAQMRTTAVRKLMPESWGFLCPVHTPDGSPCGLMNHMTNSCQLVNEFFANSCALVRLLIEIGAESYDGPPLFDRSSYHNQYTVMLDGRLVGWVSDEHVHDFVKQLRYLKVVDQKNVPRYLEICLVPKTAVASQFPGLFLFTSVARMMRPVKNLVTNSVEFIGTFEQAYLNICVTNDEYIEQSSTHMELFPFCILSDMASLTPYSDFNQSPRNMYQCQMGKQTMGVPLHAWSYRGDNKLYRLHSAQSPVVRSTTYNYFDMDNYPIGANAVVAVLSYTGFDMEDAMVINKGCLDRGFGNGTIIKTQMIDLKDVNGEKFCRNLLFGTNPVDFTTGDKLDVDGLPPVGTLLQDGDPFYSYVDLQTGKYTVVNYKSYEAAYVDSVKLIGNELGNGFFNRVSITLRIPRNPVIGDKFSSRHGQKGILSQKWPMQNMPFSESGIIPDIIFNPHGFPSRMTIGMIIEFMAGKSAAMHGVCHDSTPFVFNEKETALDYFGVKLREAGYKYTGEETMYSGITGLPFVVSIFTGVVYYQRLRHMVSDKYQVRTTGPVDAVTHQPVQGRKKGGGIRLGEMERDALIAHGTAFLLHDRLFKCSDGTLAHVCKKCGSLISPTLDRPTGPAGGPTTSTSSLSISRRWRCLVCTEDGGKNEVVTIRVPHVFKYLVAELAAMNVATVLDVRQQ